MRAALEVVFHHDSRVLCHLDRHPRRRCVQFRHRRRQHSGTAGRLELSQLSRARLVRRTKGVPQLLYVAMAVVCKPGLAQHAAVGTARCQGRSVWLQPKGWHAGGLDGNLVGRWVKKEKVDISLAAGSRKLTQHVQRGPGRQRGRGAVVCCQPDSSGGRVVLRVLQSSPPGWLSASRD